MPTPSMYDKLQAEYDKLRLAAARVCVSEHPAQGADPAPELHRLWNLLGDFTDADLVERNGRQMNKVSRKMANRESIWGGIRAGLTYEQNALLRAYGAPTYEERERALDGIATDILARVTSGDDRRRAVKPIKESGD